MRVSDPEQSDIRYESSESDKRFLAGIAMLVFCAVFAGAAFMSLDSLAEQILPDIIAFAASGLLSLFGFVLMILGSRSVLKTMFHSR